MIIVKLKKISNADNLNYVVVVSAHNVSPTGNKFLEKIGFYKPLTDKWSNKYLFVDIDRLLFWLHRGARINVSVFLLIRSLLFQRLYSKSIK